MSDLKKKLKDKMKHIHGIHKTFIYLVQVMINDFMTFSKKNYFYIF